MKLRWARWTTALVGAAALVATACGGGGGETSTEAATAVDTATDGGAEPTEDGDGTGQPPEALELVFSCSPGAFSMVPLVLGQELGFDQDVGLEIDCINVTSGPEQSAAMLAGDMDAALGVPLLLAQLWEGGEDVGAFAYFYDAELFDIIVRADYPLPSADEGWEGVMRDLEGSRFGVVALGAAAHSLAQGLFTEAGLSPDAANFIAVGSGPTAVPALEEGEVDAVLISEPDQSRLVLNGDGIRPFSVNDETGPDFVDWGSMVLWTTGQTAQEKPEELCRLKTMWQRSIDYMRDEANRDQVAQFIGEYVGADEELGEIVLDANLSLYPESVDVDPDRLDPSLDWLQSVGAIDQEHTFADHTYEVC